MLTITLELTLFKAWPEGSPAGDEPTATLLLPEPPALAPPEVLLAPVLKASLGPTKCDAISKACCASIWLATVPNRMMPSPTLSALTAESGTNFAIALVISSTTRDLVGTGLSGT